MASPAPLASREATTVPGILCCRSLAIVKGQNWQNSGKGFASKKDTFLILKKEGIRWQLNKKGRWCRKSGSPSVLAVLVYSSHERWDSMKFGLTAAISVEAAGKTKTGEEFYHVYVFINL